MYPNDNTILFVL